MEENKARRVVDALRERGTDADMARVGVYQFGVTVNLRDGRQAVWDSDGTAALAAVKPARATGAPIVCVYVPAVAGVTPSRFSA